MFNPFKPKIEVIIKKIGEHSDLPDDRLMKYVEMLTVDPNWQYLEELVRRKREATVSGMVAANEEKHLFNAQGTIKAYDWLLKLKQ